jgi:hypothetical protein
MEVSAFRVLVATASAAAVLIAVGLPAAAHGAFPGGNGALLLTGAAESGHCSFGPEAPSVVGRASDDTPCEDPPIDDLLYLLRPRGWSPALSGLHTSDGSLAGAVSPGGWRAAFTSSSGRLMLMPLVPGAHATALSPKGWFPRSIAWTADGSALTVEVKGTLWTVSAASGARRKLLKGLSPRWSVRGDLVFCRRDGLYVLRNGAARPRRVPLPRSIAPPTQADWSPTGRRLVLTPGPSNDDDATAAVFTLAPDGSHRRRLTTFWTPAHGETDGGRAIWSPDGRRIVFQTGEEWKVRVLSSSARSPQKWWRRTVVTSAGLLDWQPVP